MIENSGPEVMDGNEKSISHETYSQPRDRC
jgi:hypothetical protein